MRTTQLFAAAAAAAAAALVLAACQRSTTDDFENPIPGPPDTCAAIAPLTGCDQGSLSYACTAARPDDDGNTDLVCSDGTPGGGGATLYCCAPYAQPYSDCTTDTTIVGCDGVALGFACSSGGGGGGDPPTTPSDADPTIACSAAITTDGTAQYCCNTAAVPATCAIDPTVAACTGVAVGYSCVNGDAPFADNPAFACATEAVLGGSTGYCCVPFAAAPDACTPSATDDAAACPAGEYSFDCVGSATPSTHDAALHCTAGATASNPTEYCCTL